MSANILNTQLEDRIASLKQRIANGETIPEADKVQVAVLADSPTVVTGFGNVCREVLKMLHDTGLYAFEVVGINYDGSPHDFPYRIHPAYNSLIPAAEYRDVYGRQKFLDVIGQGKFDLVWVLQDSFILAEGLARKIQETNQSLPAERKFQFIFYYPIDATPKKHWIEESVLLADFPVVYTRYGYEETLKIYSVGEDSLLEKAEQEENLGKLEALRGRLNVIYHGANLEHFFPVSEEDRLAIREKLWGDHKDKFVFINVNRNQPRKDLFRTLQAFKILLDSRRAKGKDDVYLYLHCSLVDTGLNLLDMSKQIGLVEGDEYAYPDPKGFSTNAGYPIEVVNQFYNAADAVVSTTLGEGWGLSLTEGMAVGKPIIAPDHTSISEILGKTNSGGAERGILVKTKGDFVQHDDNSRVRPITDPEDLAKWMEYVVDNREALQPMVDRASAWVRELEWGGVLVGDKWKALFETAYEQTLIRRAQEIDIAIAIGLKEGGMTRNEICPVCTPEKFKHCRHGKG